MHRGIQDFGAGLGGGSSSCITTFCMVMERISDFRRRWAGQRGPPLVLGSGGGGGSRVVGGEDGQRGSLRVLLLVSGKAGGDGLVRENSGLIKISNSKTKYIATNNLKLIWIASKREDSLVNK